MAVKPIIGELAAAKTYTWAEYRKAERHGDRDTRAYHKWRRQILKRDKHKCQLCGRKNDLNVHHIRQYTDNIFLRIAKSNGITLCKECHKKQHPWMCKPFVPKVILRKKGENPMVNMVTKDLGDPERPQLVTGK